MKYALEPKNPTKACKAMGVDLRVSFKNTYETCRAIKGMNVQDAKKYLHAVLEKKRCIPFRRFTGGVGRCAQAKEFKTTQGRWPVKSVKMVLGLIQNAESNAEFKNLDADNMKIDHIMVTEAQRGRRRTYRAHGRINPYMSSPCHIQMILQEKEEAVEKPKEEKAPKRFTKRQLAKQRLKVGGGA
eukprot:CAMPEP_0178378220 /NCGR_PEP_ID=MMETSP0689_2-20121128/4317_1 /TAXON_ID=160604 /ORGANISM="Amphidinium massartii, Strain CS-259" /LENGTH=184 /DNA_ID=CAMNT_0019998289 /DNA_START=1285 /DNA_END=1839 /DNA_ORIENTATION=+